MRLTSISFEQFPGDPREWKLDDLKLGTLNLIVGRNASGKTRTVNVIWALARLLNGAVKPVFASSRFVVRFDNKGTLVEYTLKMDRGSVVEERLVVGDQEKLMRGHGGQGRIWVNKLNQFLEFQAPQNEVAAVVRRDQLQHDFLEPLHVWSQSVLHYAFGTSLGRDRLGLFVKGPAELLFDPKDPHAVVGIFHRGVEKHGKAFKTAIAKDMKSVGYEIDDIGLCTPSSVSVVTEPPGEIRCLFVRETALNAVTEQFEMSQGMFRALSLIINLNYATLELNPTCILIDDIGEGLDFSRSCALIDLLMAKSESKIQLVMTSNDRFVMNRVPLTDWTVLTRHGSTCRINNYDNSKEIFDEFAFTGLNNFDFFSTDFVESAPSTADDQNA